MKSSLSLKFQFIFLVLFHLQYFQASPSSFLTLSSNSSFSSSAVLCPYEQSRALLQFKSSFSIDTTASDSDPEYGYAPFPKTKSWKEGTDCCLWDGVTCDLETGYVISIDLSSSMLYGTFHSNSSLFSLSHLQKLDLSNNAFIGKVPSEISHLSNLVSLDLSGNVLNMETTGFNKIVQNRTKLRELILNEVDMSMVAPISFMNLSSFLSSFGLADCGLRGEFPGILFQRPSLQWLDISGNDNVTGVFSGSNGNISLQYLDLSETKIEIHLESDFISNLRSLKVFYLRGCNLICSKLALFGNLTELTHLDLSSNNINGEIPPPFTNLKQLSYLLLYNNSLSGPLPTYFSNFTQLIRLDLSLNNFSEEISPSFGNLLQLTELDLSNNNFNGEIPPSFGNLRQLSVLDLSNNNFNGEIPPSFGNLQQLIKLLLSDNKFKGEIPHSFGNLQQLTWLDLSSNNLSGEIPSSFTNLNQLSELHLDNNSLNGLLSTSFSNFTLLDSLNLRNNKMTGPIPSEIDRLSILKFLDLSNNLFNGTIPSSLLTLPDLQFLSLKHNELHRLVGDFYSGSVSYIDLSNNKLHGAIPSSISNLRNLHVLILSSNGNLTGHVPISICKLQLLQILDLSNNSLSGVIPKCLGNFSNSLEVLHLGMNYFNGTIPPTFSEGNPLTYINFYKNKLQGQVPSSIINCRNLKFLDLSNNEIDDTFPFFLGALPVLQVLILRFNKFHGFVNNFSLNNPFPSLRIFDLSNNKLSGPLPARYFDHFKAMMSFDKDMIYMRFEGNYLYDYSVRLTFKGLEIELVKIQSLLTIIDFSCNNFTGSIPQSIGMLKSLKLLNMSHNRITGNIHSSLGNLTNLESLDLSSNLFTGRIPNELENLTFLEVFRVSYNQLEGPIPHGKQFSTFDVSSYEGNSGLCGFPLGKDCSNGESQQLIPPDEEYSKSENGFGWEAVLIGYGCGVLFGLIIGYVVFKTRKYSWFARMVEVEGYVWRKKFDKIKNSRKPHRRRN